MEQLLIRNLPQGTKARLRARAEENRHSMEAEARSILERALGAITPTIVDLVSTCDDDIDFEPERLRYSLRDAEL